MASSYYDDDVSDSPARLEIVQTATRWTGAVVSVSLVLGLGVWSYKMMVRDISGVPVIQAMSGPARTAPEDPGGHKAAHQGLSVNRIAALGEAAPPPDTVTLAPRPAALAAEDRPMATTPMARPNALPDRVILASARPGDIPRLGAGDLRDTGRPVADAEALAARKSADAKALAVEVQQDAAAEAKPPVNVFGSALDAALAEALGVEKAVLRSPRPASRPVREGVKLAALEPTAGQIASLAPAVIDPDNLPAGTRLVQLGAYDDRAEAEAAWDQIETRFGAYLEGRQPVIQSAESNGRSFYRLRAHGFVDEGDARRFCAALLAEQANCIPVMIR